jgi:hypothetical protein
MKTRSRWMKWILTETEATEFEMPWSYDAKLARRVKRLAARQTA